MVWIFIEKKLYKEQNYSIIIFKRVENIYSDFRYIMQ